MSQEWPDANFAALSRQIADEKFRLSDLRDVLDAGTGHLETIWSSLVEMGWTGIGVPEERGGSGGSFSDLVTVLSSLGSQAVPSPLVSNSVMASTLLCDLGQDHPSQELLSDICNGITRAAVAISAEAPSFGAVVAPQVGLEQGRVTGRVPYVLDAQHAGKFLVPALAGAGLTIVVVDVGTPGLSLSPVDFADATRWAAHVVFDGVEPEFVLANDSDAAESLRRCLRRAATAIAADCVGGARRALEMTVSHVTNRHQFGRTLGSFQAVKHHCANMLTSLATSEIALRSAVFYESVGHRDDSFDWISAAKAHCADAYLAIAELSVHCHGAMGFTWEYELHRFLKRARLNQQLFGSSHAHRDHIARDLLARSSMDAAELVGRNG